MIIDPATFRCERCGACCRVPGYVALAAGEPEAIAAYLGMDVYAFTEAYATFTFNRKDLSLIEQEDGRCIFLQDDNTCRIQAVKPAQCKGFPFLWRSKRLEKECAARRELHRWRPGVAVCGWRVFWRGSVPAARSITRAPPPRSSAAARPRQP